MKAEQIKNNRLKLKLIRQALKDCDTEHMCGECLETIKGMKKIMQGRPQIFVKDKILKKLIKPLKGREITLGELEHSYKRFKEMRDMKVMRRHQS